MGNIRLSGFTVVKSGLRLGYPFIQSIKSLAPICDEVIVNVGFDDPELKEDDGTWRLLRDTFPESKFVFLKSWWDPAISSGGKILAQQTDLALNACQGDFCHYIQADEAIHQEDFSHIEEAVRKMQSNSEIDGLVYNYLHFYGDPFIVKYTRDTYRREVRLIRNHRNIRSWLDAQGFRFPDKTKLHCQLIPATIYHYGWSRQEQIMDRKNKAFGKLFHGQEYQEDDFAYEHIWGLRPFKGTHPAAMGDWVEKNRNDKDILAMPLKPEWRNIGLAINDWIEGLCGYRMGEYKNYKLIKNLSEVR